MRLLVSETDRVNFRSFCTVSEMGGIAACKGQNRSAARRITGESAFDCIDRQEVEVPDLDDEEEDEGHEPRMPRRRRTKKYLEAVENTPCDACTSFGFLISLTGDKVEIEPKAMRDVDGDCELEMVVEPNLLSKSMRNWVRSFWFPKRGVTA